MLNVGIVGCGKISDQHVLAISRLSDCQIVGACDREELMAGQLADRFGIPGRYSDVDDLIRGSKPDVVHITTPPQSHLSLARQCLEAGVHVYLEKPFTVTAEEAEFLTDLASSRGLVLTAGHNYQFTLEMQRMRQLVTRGYLGGKPVHLESHWSYDLGDASYVGPVLGNPNHWVRQLPGQLFHNILSHGIARLAEYLEDEIDQITATAHQSPRLQALGGGDVKDELRVMLRDRSGTTAFFCFSTQVKPGLNRFRVCGPSNSLVVDLSNGTLFEHENRAYKSYLTYFVPPFLTGWRQIRSGFRNISDFMARRLYQDSGMTSLIGNFYQSIRQNGAPPIPYREIRLTARIMDEIFRQVYPPKPAPAADAQPVMTS